MDLNARLLTNLDNLFHRIKNGVCFAALMNDKTAIIFSDNFAHFNNFLGLTISTGHIDKPRGKPDSTIFHFPTDNVLHLL